MIGFIILASLGFAVCMDIPVFLGDAFRVAIITIWSELYYLDTISYFGGTDLFRSKAQHLPIVWMVVFAFLDFPFSVRNVNTSSLPCQIFGYVIGKVYGYIAWRCNWVPTDWKERRRGDLHEFISSHEVFVYGVIAIFVAYVNANELARLRGGF